MIVNFLQAALIVLGFLSLYSNIQAGKSFRHGAQVYWEMYNQMRMQGVDPSDLTYFLDQRADFIKQSQRDLWLRAVVNIGIFSASLVFPIMLRT